jgi:hypothetical protein
MVQVTLRDGCAQLKRQMLKEAGVLTGRVCAVRRQAVNRGTLAWLETEFPAEPICADLTYCRKRPILPTLPHICIEPYTE